MLEMINPKLNQNFVVVEKGKKVLCVEIQKVICGILKASLLFWDQVSQDFSSWGFDISLYKCCITNKMINGKQYTIGWQVDDFMIIHMDPQGNNGIIKRLETKYIELIPPVVHHGHIHDYLGTTLYFSQ